MASGSLKLGLTVRGYKDQQASELQTYAGTATRWSQRIVNFMVVQKGWRLFSADVGQAFLRGLSFEQIQEMDGEVYRDVQFTVPPGSVPILQTLQGYANFDPIQEVLAMLRAGFGLKDAPRLWQKKLQQVLEKSDAAAYLLTASCTSEWQASLDHVQSR